MAALAGCAASGCGDSGPTEPKPASLPDLFGNQLYKADGSSVTVGSLSGTPVIGIYFASPSCPACGAFTPLLVDPYTQWRGDGRPFEVVLVTGGISEATLFAYMTGAAMPWLALSPGSEKVNALARRYDVQWVPTLIVIDGTGKTISMNGREELTVSGAAIYDVWLGAGGGS